MSNKELARNALYVYMLLAPLIAVYLLFFVRMEFLLQMTGIVLVGVVLIALGIANLLIK